MSSILVTDILHELKEENKRLLNELLYAKQCLKVLIEFKINFDFYSNKFKQSLEINEWKKFEKLNEEIIGIVFKLCGNRVNTNSDYITEDVIKTEETLNEHLRQTSDQLVSQDVNPNEQNMRVKCDICDRSYSNKRSLSKHKSITHRKVQQKSKTCGKRIGKYLCDWPGCDYQCRSQSRVREHRITKHYPDDDTTRKFTCSYPGCSKKFKIKRCLSVHLESHKTGERVQCQHCGKDFKDSTCLKNHVLHQHNNERNFVCNHSGCQYSTTTAARLKMHVTYHSDRSIVCTVEGCDKRFKTKNCLKSHMTSHNTEYIYKCPFNGCDKRFKTEKYSKTHYRLQHTKKELFRCDWPGCDFQTKFRASYLRHTHSTHKSERDFICEWPECGKGFKNKAQLELHTRRHTNDKRYVCLWPGCQYSTTDSGNFVKHRKQVHEKSINYNRNKK